MRSFSRCALRITLLERDIEAKLFDDNRRRLKVNSLIDGRDDTVFKQFADHLRDGYVKFFGQFTDGDRACNRQDFFRGICHSSLPFSLIGC